jgi:hypothetical protein
VRQTKKKKKKQKKQEKKKKKKKKRNAILHIPRRIPIGALARGLGLCSGGHLTAAHAVCPKWGEDRSRFVVAAAPA